MTYRWLEKRKKAPAASNERRDTISLLCSCKSRAMFETLNYPANSTKAVQGELTSNQSQVRLTFAKSKKRLNFHRIWEFPSWCQRSSHKKRMSDENNVEFIGVSKDEDLKSSPHLITTDNRKCWSNYTAKVNRTFCRRAQIALRNLRYLLAYLSAHSNLSVLQNLQGIKTFPEGRLCCTEIVRNCAWDSPFLICAGRQCPEIKPDDFLFFKARRGPDHNYSTRPIVFAHVRNTTTTKYLQTDSGKSQP